MVSELFKTPQMRLLGALVLFMILVAVASYARLNFATAEFINPNPAMISVSGEGEVLAKPDIGQFSFSVNAEGESAPAVQEESGKKVNGILKDHFVHTKKRMHLQNQLRILFHTREFLHFLGIKIYPQFHNRKFLQDR